MTGSGTLADPYIIWDITDLQNMSLDLTAHYQLGQDINASNPAWEWAAQTRRPTGDFATAGVWVVFPAAPATFWDKVDEDPADEDVTYIETAANGASAFFSFANFAIAAGSEHPVLTVMTRLRNTAPGITIRFNLWIRVNGVNYTHAGWSTCWSDIYDNFGASWALNPNTNLPWTLADLNGVGPNPLQAFGISKSSVGGTLRITQMYAMVSSTGFTPIGDYDIAHPEYAFSGSFDGKNHKITNLRVNRLPPIWMNFAGLFGYTLNSGEIKNVGIVDCDISGYEWVGALIGFHDTFMPRGTISNCYSTGIIRVWVGGGGLLGYNGATVTNCHSECEISGDARQESDASEVGGFVGNSDGDITDCYCTGNVTMSSGIPTGGTQGDVTMIAGFIADHTGGTILRCYCTGNVTAWSDGDISYIGGFSGVGWTTNRCFCTGNVSATGNIPGTWNSLWCVGGFVGQAAEQNNCYSRGNVYASHPADCSLVGGFNGDIWDGSIIVNCYSTGLVTALGVPVDIGGFCGDIFAGTITNCFWDVETSGMLLSDGGTGKSTIDLKTLAIFIIAGWDILNSIWHIVGTCNDGYPCLDGVTPGCILLPPPPARQAVVQTLPASDTPGLDRKYVRTN